MQRRSLPALEMESRQSNPTPHRPATGVSQPWKWNQGKAPLNPRSSPRQSPSLGNGIKAKLAEGRERVAPHIPILENGIKAIPDSGSPSPAASLPALEMESRQSRRRPPASATPVSQPWKWNQGKATETRRSRSRQSPSLGNGIKAKPRGRLSKNLFSLPALEMESRQSW